MSAKYTVAGIMSGTSLDGLDIAICNFEDLSGRWGFEILAATTLPYTENWQKKLSGAFNISGSSLVHLHAEYGRFIGESVLQFCRSQHIKPQLIASHGHTIFHQPANGFTFQLGCGAQVAAITGIDTVCDFRSTDVALGGQGAPLVPVGDHYLFGGHKFCLNLGGFANISFEENNQRFAFDICPANIALNFLAMKKRKPFDMGGKLALKGFVKP
jgi:anhydro-N-acetylmuramic acid kinase